MAEAFGDAQLHLAVQTTYSWSCMAQTNRDLHMKRDRAVLPRIRNEYGDVMCLTNRCDMKFFQSVPFLLQ